MDWHDFFFGLVSGIIITVCVCTNAPWWAYAGFGIMFGFYYLAAQYVWWGR